MPTGAAFFTGNATAPQPIAPAATANGGSRISRPDLTQRIMRPNEAEFLAQSASSSNMPKSEADSSDLPGVASMNSIASYYAAQNKAHEASDSDDIPDTTDPVDKHGAEIWPPTQYESSAPVTLPLGPKTTNMRSRLAAEVRCRQYDSHSSASNIVLCVSLLHHVEALVST